MNIFKKIGAALLAAALITSTAAVTASAEEEVYYSFKTGHTADGKDLFSITNIPQNAFECDKLTLYTVFTTVKYVDGELNYDHSHKYQVIGWYEPAKPTSGYWSVYDNEVGEYIKGSGGSLALTQYDEKPALSVIYDSGSPYISDIFNNSNAVQMGVLGEKNGKSLWYLPNGSTFESQVTSFNLLKEPEKEPIEPITQDSIDVEIERMEGGIILTLKNVPVKYAECDQIFADIQFTTVTRENGDYILPGFNRYSLRALQRNGDNYGAYVIYDNETGEWQERSSEEDTRLAFYSANDNTYTIAIEEGSKYFEDSFTDFNAVYVEVYGFTNNERINYTNNNELTQEKQAQLIIIGDVEEINDPTTSDTSSDTSDTSSDTSGTSSDTSDTSSDTSTTSSETSSTGSNTSSTSSDTSSTSSDTSDTSSDTSSTSAETSDIQPSGDNNPATGAAIALIPIALIGGAVIIAAKKRK